MRLKKSRVINIFILVFVFIVLMETNCWAKLDEYLYKNSSRKVNYILTKDYSKNGTLYDKLNESIVWTTWHSGTPDAVCEVDWARDSYYFYYWLHGIKDMVSYIQKDGITYEILSEEDKEDLYASIKVLTYTKGALGSFVVENKNLPRPDVIIWGGDEEVMEFQRSGSAYGEITGTGKKYQEPNGDVVVDEFEIKVNKAIQELQAAYDYGNQTAEFGESVYIRDSDEEKSNYTEAQIRHYINVYGDSAISDEIEEGWEEKIGMTLEEANEDWWGKSSTGTVDAEEARRLSEEKEDKDVGTVFLQPKGSANGANGVEDAINDAESFVTDGDATNQFIKLEDLQKFSQNLYSILLSIGVVVAVLIGAILGVKLMLSSVGERAEAKKLLIPYVVGCVIVFGAFGIWKLVVTIMQEI